MALDARLVRRIEVEEVFVFSPVRLVAAQALHSDVGIPGVDDLLTDRVRRMRLPFVAVRAELDRRRFFRQEEIVGTVGGVAFGALPFCDRWMLGPRSHLPLHRIGMAFAANFEQRRFQQKIF